MKKALSKTKNILSTIRVAISSFPFKTLGTDLEAVKFQTDYWVLYSWEELLAQPNSTAITIIKIAQIWLTAVIFIVWIINLVKIRKIDDKLQKKEKIKKTIITIAIILMVILLLSVVAYRLSIM